MTYIPYVEAQKLIPIFDWYGTHGQWKEVRSDARMLAHELRAIQDVDYSPLSGRQTFLTPGQLDFLDDVRAGAVE